MVFVDETEDAGGMHTSGTLTGYGVRCFMARLRLTQTEGRTKVTLGLLSLLGVLALCRPVAVIKTYEMVLAYCSVHFVRKEWQPLGRNLVSELAIVSALRL